MSKKRAKSGTGSAGAGRWESGLLATPFEEECWTCFVGKIVPSQFQDREYADSFCLSVKAGHRKLFSLVTYKGLIEEVHELGNPKGKKPKEVPAFSEICESAKVHLDSGEPIPLPLLAKLVKWKLLAIKHEDQKRRETEQKDADGNGSKDKKSGKKSARGKSAKGKGKKSPEVPSPKKESTLKKRGEESQENKYIDDEPDDGPHHYILLYGFLEAPLMVLLSELGINIDCILRLTSEDYGLFERRKVLREEEEDIPKSQEVIEAEQAAEAKATEEIQKFWKQYEPLLKKASAGSSLHDLARLTYTVSSDIVPEQYEDPTSQAEFGEALFEDVACMIYELLDQKRQYQNYKDNMKLIHISAPTAQTEARPPSSGTAAPPVVGPSTTLVQLEGQQTLPGPGHVDMRYYRDLMDTVPAECSSVPLIMHCMLEQVVATDEGRDPPSALRSQPRSDGLDHALAAHIDSISAKFDLGPKKEDKSIKAAGNKNEQFPVFYHHGDKSSEQLRHLICTDGFDHLAAEQAMMKLLPVSMVTKFPRPSTAVIKQRSARLHELLYRCFQEGMDPAVMDHTLRKFVFESLVVRSTDPRGRVQRDGPNGEIVWDDPYLNAQGKKHGCADGSKTDELSVPVVPSVPDISRPLTPGSGILKSRQGSASSVRSSKSQVHFKDSSAAGENNAEPRVHESNVSVPDRKQSPTPSQISVQDVGDRPQRKLDEWCFVEHLKPNVLLQVLEEARTLCPFIDTYYNRKDHSLLVVMHNPVGSDRRNIVSWDAKLHSDVGFRNYLEHVSEYISDWTEKEEEKYLADLRQQEIAAELAAAKLASTTESPSSSRPGSGKGRPRSQSPKKSRSKSPKGRKSASPGPSASNLDPNSSSFMRPNSLKAWKVEHDRELAEEERKKQEKDKRGARKKSAGSRTASPKKEEKEEKGKTDDSKKRSSSGSGRGSRKGEKEKSGEVETKDELSPEKIVEPERYYPFVGYDVGNKMIHASGSLTSLFPTEGGLVCCERTEFINGDVFIQATVLRDGHALTIHMTDPTDPSEDNGMNGQRKSTESDQPADGPQSGRYAHRTASNYRYQDADQKPAESSQEPLSRFGSFTATLNDGMVLSFSGYGKHGAPKTPGSEQEVDVNIIPVTAPSPLPPPVSPKGGRGGSGGKKGKKGAPAASVTESEKTSHKTADQPKEEECKPTLPTVNDVPDVAPYQQLYVSCPNGLHVIYMLEAAIPDLDKTENGQQRNLLVRQSYPSKTAGKQPCEAPLLNPAMKEKCRYVNSLGAVIKLLEDGSTEVLFPTGAVSRGTVSATVNGDHPSSRGPSPQRAGSSTSTHPGNVKGLGSKVGDQNNNGLPECDPGSPGTAMEWVTTTVNGDLISTKPGDPLIQQRAVMLYSAKDPVTEEVMTTREDKVVIVERPDGTRIVDHSDGTRITSYAVEVEYREAHCDSEETGELAPLKVRSVQHTKVECSGYATVIFNCEDSIATTVFGNGSQVIAIPDGSYEVLHHDGARITIAEDGCVQFIPAPKEADGGVASILPAVYTLQHQEKVICNVKERNGNNFTVNWKGEVVSDVNHDEVDLSEEKELGEESKEPDAKEGTRMDDKVCHVPRYFVVNADGSGCELLREGDILEYFRQMEMDPSTAFIQDPLPDHPEIQGITVMRPYPAGDHSNNWLMTFDESNIVPANLRPRDFSNLPSSEMMKPGQRFGVNVGRGLAVGSSKDKLQPPPAPQCPWYLQLRQFTRYKPINAAVRRNLEESLECYARKAEEQAKVDAERELKDPRSEEEKIVAGDLLAQILAQDEDQQNEQTSEVKDAGREHPVAKTDPPISLTSAKPVNVEDPALSRELYESSTAPDPLPLLPKPQNKYTEEDWERVRAELEEEQANREALRRREVPPYFESQWGKCFLAAQEASKLDNPDMEGLAKRLAEGTIKGTQPPSNSLPDTPVFTPHGDRQSEVRVGRQSKDSKRLSDPSTNVPLLQTPGGGQSPSVQGAAESPSNVRPTNPTPSHAAGTGTPTQVRPTAPTPGHASQTEPFMRPGNPIASGTHEGPALPSTTPSSYASYPNHPSTIPEHPEESNGIDEENEDEIQGENNFSDETLPMIFSSESVFDGDTRKKSGSPLKTPSSANRGSSVRLPAAIQGQKPGAIPNQQFQAVEEPVRRKVTTSSLAGLSGETKISTNRGFELVPGEVFFGELREGCTYSMTVNLKNVGIDSCRYKIKQPPPATGLQVVYKPGPVAAGMKAELKIVLYAIAVGVEGESGRGSIGHHIEITTETDFIFLPVSAYILTAHKYDEECRVRGRPYLSPGVHVLSSRPPSREGIIRPRKDGLSSGSEEIAATQ